LREDRASPSSARQVSAAMIWVGSANWRLMFRTIINCW
jgi:hypothetical protein